MFHSHLRAHSRLMILPPVGGQVPGAFAKVERDDHRYSRLLAGMQRLRGRAYLEDGAISPEDLTADGRHEVSADRNCWHAIFVDRDENVTACLRYMDERDRPGFRSLWVSHAALAQCPRRGWKLRQAVEYGRQRALQLCLGFGSVGGWAVSKEHRRTMEPTGIVLATYALLELLGGCVGIATATQRHHAAGILRKIGLSPLSWRGVELSSYFDPKYGCEMEILQFDSRHPNPKYLRAVSEFCRALAGAPVIGCEVSTVVETQTLEFAPLSIAAVA
jgi:hypothetical protein